MSGHTENAIVHHGVLDEGIAFIQKPFKHDLLAHKIREVLDSPRPPVSCAIEPEGNDLMYVVAGSAVQRRPNMVLRVTKQGVPRQLQGGPRLAWPTTVAVFKASR